MGKNRCATGTPGVVSDYKSYLQVSAIFCHSRPNQALDVEGVSLTLVGILFEALSDGSSFLRQHRIIKRLRDWFHFLGIACNSVRTCHFSFF